MNLSTLPTNLFPRLCERVCERPSFKAPSHGCFGHSDVSRPLGKCLGYAIKSDSYCVAAIAVLLLFRAPHAVALRVITIVVDALQSCAVWAFSHVGIKILEAAPSFANCNSPPAIGLEAARIGVLASLTHQVPNVVLARVAEAVFSRSPKRCLAATGSGVAIAKGAGHHGNLVAARTRAFPSRSRHVVFGNAANGREFAERIADLNAVCHGGMLS